MKGLPWAGVGGLDFSPFPPAGGSVDSNPTKIEKTLLGISSFGISSIDDIASSKNLNLFNLKISVGKVEKSKLESLRILKF